MRYRLYLFRFLTRPVQYTGAWLAAEGPVWLKVAIGAILLAAIIWGWTH